MAEKSLVEQIVDDFIDSIEKNKLINDSMVEKLKDIGKGEKVVNNRELESILSLEDEK